MSLATSTFASGSDSNCRAEPHEVLVYTMALLGLDATVVRVTAVPKGEAGLVIVGLPDRDLRETRVRVRASLTSLGTDADGMSVEVRLDIPEGRVGGTSDLAIVVATLGAIGRIPRSSLNGTLFLGSLSLNASIHSVRGVLPMLQAALRSGLARAVVGTANAAEASLVHGLEIGVAENVSEVVRHLAEGQLPPAPKLVPPAGPGASPELDLADFRGSASARRAIEVAAAGGHHLLVIAPPGAGSTMLLRRVPTILPPLSAEETLETTAVCSVAGLLDPGRGIVDAPPYRAPHCSASAMALVGGGESAYPGEVSLAHRGVLHLDQVMDFRRSVLETLARALAERRATVVRRGRRITFPAAPLVVATLHPCPCAWRGDSMACGCSAERRRQYLAHLPADFLDRFDIQVSMGRVDLARSELPPPGESSLAVRHRVTAARSLQRIRASTTGLPVLNADLTGQQIDQAAKCSPPAQRLLTEAMSRLGGSDADRVRVLRVARTIADLDYAADISTMHLAEAVSLAMRYRGLPCD